jgi:3-deoxy-D-manno-octulosonic-acid transferase
MSAVLTAYRLLAGAVGAIALPLGRAASPPRSPWRSLWGSTDGLEAIAGSPWIHAASMGEAVAARCWGTALLADGYRPPFYVTTRTRAGLERVRREWNGHAVAALAPLDFPQGVRRVLRAAAPMRLDLIETELWPHLILEAHRGGIPVLVVSATVSARTTRRLRSLGLSGPALFGPLFVLAQSERAAERYRSLGVAPERCRVIGDVKADALPVGSAIAPDANPESRRLVVFASARPGEEETAVAAARAMASRRDAGAWRFVVAPRHDRGVRSFEGALTRAGFEVDVRGEASRGAFALHEWAVAPARGAAPRVGLLATRGELAELFPMARVALVGGTFSPWGGHNVLEPAAFGCAVLVGPHHSEVEAGVALLTSHHGGAVVPDAASAAATLSAWLDESAADGSRSRGALAAADAARGASRRGLDALSEWGLVP